MRFAHLVLLGGVGTGMALATTLHLILG